MRLTVDDIARLLAANVDRVRAPRLLLAVAVAWFLSGTPVVSAYAAPPPGLGAPSSFFVDSLTAGRDSAGTPYLLAQVHNTGGRALRLSGSLRLKDGPGGRSAGPFTAKLVTTLAIGQSGPVLVSLDKAVSAGRWLVRLQLQSGKLRGTVEATVVFPARLASQSPPVVPTEVPVTDKHPAVIAIAVTLVGVMSVALLWLSLPAFLRRRRADVTHEDDGPAK